MRLITLFLVLLMSWPATASTSRRDLNSMIAINYGTVQDISTVKLKSDAGKTAVLGGIIGASTSGNHNRGKHAAEGALAGALLSALVQHKNKANQYLINLGNGSSVKVITEQGGIRVGDCVSVEQGSMTNVRRVSGVYCSEPEHEALSHPTVQAKGHHDAAACQQAKELALAADTETGVDIALKKVQIFCDT